MTADLVMKKEVRTLPTKATVKEIMGALTETTHNGFPVIGRNKNLKGLISRNYLMVLLQKKCWLTAQGNDEFTMDDQQLDMKFGTDGNSAKKMSLNGEFGEQKEKLIRRS